MATIAILKVTGEGVMVGIVDYGTGNLLSVYNAVLMVGGEARICAAPKELERMDRIVLPGVGAFRDCMRNLHERGFVEVLNQVALEKRKPIFGICLGMQAMARRSFEGGEYEGLGWFDADVVRLTPPDSSLRVPQIGWNDIEFRQDSALFTGTPQGAEFYFVHSYFMKCDDEKDIEATCDYAQCVTAAVRKHNIFATQFHPEKSQDHGLRILENFLHWNP